MSNDDELLSLARMGVDAESFMGTTLGKFLTMKAAAEIDAATAELIAADPDDVKANTDLRNQINVAGMFLTWMRESISIGRAAHEQLKMLEE